MVDIVKVRWRFNLRKFSLSADCSMYKSNIYNPFSMLFLWHMRVKINTIFANLYSFFFRVDSLVWPSLPGYPKTSHLSAGEQWCTVNCRVLWHKHYCDVIIGAIGSLITSLTSVYSTIHSGADQRKRQSSASLAFGLGIHRRQVNSPHKCPVTRKMFPFDDVTMKTSLWCNVEGVGSTTSSDVM